MTGMTGEQFRKIEELANGLFTRRQLDGLAEYRYQVAWFSQLDRSQADDLIAFLGDYHERQKAQRANKKAERELARQRGAA